MFDADDVFAHTDASGVEKDEAPSKAPAKTVGAHLGTMGRSRLEDWLGGLYFDVRITRKRLRKAIAEVETALNSGDSIGPTLPNALYEYELARLAWRTSYQTVARIFGSDAARDSWLHIRARHGDDGATDDAPD